MNVREPPLVIPRAFDQFDNAERVVRLGCGLQLAGRKLSLPRLRSMVRRLVEDRAIKTSAVNVSKRIERGAAERAAQVIMNRLRTPTAPLAE